MHVASDNGSSSGHEEPHGRNVLYKNALSFPGSYRRINSLYLLTAISKRPTATDERFDCGPVQRSRTALSVSVSSAFIMLDLVGVKWLD